MSLLERIKNTIDWGRRGQFLYQLAIGLFGAAAWKTAVAIVSLTKIPPIWHLPIYLASSAVVLFLLTALYIGWSSRRAATTREQDWDAVEDVLRTGGEVRLYDFLNCRARELIIELDRVWHLWHNAGEKLIHPLDGKIDKVQNADTSTMFELMDARRDFLVLYSHHLMTMKASFPDYTSRMVEGGYPSNRQFVEVRADLVEHADKLERLLKSSWKTYGRPLE